MPGIEGFAGRRFALGVAGKICAALALPARGAWRRLAIEAAWSLPPALLIWTAGGLVEPGLVEDPGLLVRLALVALVAPAPA